MRLPASQTLMRIPVGDRRARLEHHLRRRPEALVQLSTLARRCGVPFTPKDIVMNSNSPTPDREQITRRAANAIEVAAERLSGLGVSDIEVGRAMVAIGLSRMSRGMPAGQLVEEMANVVGGIAAANGIDLKAAAEKPASPAH